MATCASANESKSSLSGKLNSGSISSNNKAKALQPKSAI